MSTSTTSARPRADCRGEGMNTAERISKVACAILAEHGIAARPVDPEERDDHTLAGVYITENDGRMWVCHTWIDRNNTTTPTVIATELANGVYNHVNPAPQRDPMHAVGTVDNGWKIASTTTKQSPITEERAAELWKQSQQDAS